MAYTYQIDRQARLVCVRFDDVLTPNIAKAYLDEAWRDDPSLRGFNEIADLLALSDIRMTTGDVASMASYGNKLDDTSQSSRLALVTRDRKVRMLAAIYRTLRLVIPGNLKKIEVFDDEAAARQWLMHNG